MRVEKPTHSAGRSTKRKASMATAEQDWSEVSLAAERLPFAGVSNRARPARLVRTGFFFLDKIIVRKWAVAVASRGHAEAKGRRRDVRAPLAFQIRAA